MLCPRAFPRHVAGHFYSGSFSRLFATHSSVGSGQFTVPSKIPFVEWQRHPTSHFQHPRRQEINAWMALVTTNECDVSNQPEFISLIHLQHQHFNSGHKISIVCNYTRSCSWLLSPNRA